MVKFLLEEIEISPHRLLNNGDGIYHTILRSLRSHPPAQESFTELRTVNEMKWREVENQVKEQNDRKQMEREGCQMPESVNHNAE